MTTANLPLIEDKPEAAEDEARARAALLPEGVNELPFDDAMQLAMRLHREGRLLGAQQLYERLLAAAPANPDVKGMLALVEHQMGRPERAIELLRQAVAAVPQFMGFHLNLGNILLSNGRFDEAEVTFRRASELTPDNVDLLNNLSVLQRLREQPQAALATLERAAEIEPEHPRTWSNLGELYEQLGRVPDAIQAYLRSLKVSPDNSVAAVMLGRAYVKIGRQDMAVEVYRQWAHMFPDDPCAQHLLAAASGQEVPERASDAFVEQHFDRFSASFDYVLNQRLNYRAPELCAQMLGEQLGDAQGRLELVDLGCGTGLCGPLIAPWAQRLVGVDLSGGMLLQARSKGGYHELVKAELTQFLESGAAAWDAAVCADTLCYFGDLGAVMRAAATALRPGAPLVFTVEALEDDASTEARLMYSGRYCHGRAHVVQAIADAGLELAALRREVLRHEGGEPVSGWLVAVRRSA